MPFLTIPTLVVKSNSLLGGVSEVHHFNPNDNDYELHAKQLVKIRQNILANDCKIMNATLSYIGMPPNGEKVPELSFPLDGDAPRLGIGYSSSPVVNIAHDAIHCHMRAGGGIGGGPVREGNRHIRMIADDWVRKEQWEAASLGTIDTKFPVWGGTPERAEGSGFTARDYLAGYLEFLVKFTGMIRVTARGTPSAKFPAGRPIEWDFLPYNRAWVVRPSKRNVGRPWGPFRGRRRR